VTGPPNGEPPRSRRADAWTADATDLDPFAGGPDLAPVTRVLEEHRQEILNHWLASAAEQPFHRAHPTGAVADHIPHPGYAEIRQFLSNSEEMTFPRS
jgi:hypothetical protein